MRHIGRGVFLAPQLVYYLKYKGIFSDFTAYVSNIPIDDLKMMNVSPIPVIRSLGAVINLLALSYQQNENSKPSILRTYSYNTLKLLAIEAFHSLKGLNSDPTNSKLQFKRRIRRLNKLNPEPTINVVAAVEYASVVSAVTDHLTPGGVVFDVADKKNPNRYKEVI